MVYKDSEKGINDYYMNDTSVVKDVVYIKIDKDVNLVEKNQTEKEFSKIVERLIQDAISNYSFENDHKKDHYCYQITWDLHPKRGKVSTI